METYKVGVSIMGMSKFKWFSGIVDGCVEWNEQRGSELGIRFEFRFLDSHAQSEVMRENLEELVAWRPDGILVFPVDDSTAIPIMKKGREQGITFVLGDYLQSCSSPDDCVWATFVAHNMYELGAAAGRIAAGNVGEAEPTLLFVSNFDWGQSAIDRFKGFRDAVLQAIPQAKVLCASDIQKTTYDSVADVVAGILQQEGPVDIVCGHNDALVIDCYRTFQELGAHETKFIGIAGDRQVLAWIEEGNPAWIGEVVQDSAVLGFHACEALYRAMVLGEKLPEEYELPKPLGITKQNIGTFDWKNVSWL